MRRLVWLGTGAALGATGVVWGRRRLEALQQRMRPTRVAQDVAGEVGGRVRGARAHVGRAVAGGRADARQREAQLRDELRLTEPRR